VNRSARIRRLIVLPFLLILPVALPAQQPDFAQAFPQAVDAAEILKDSPLFVEALSDPQFFEKLENDRRFAGRIRRELGSQAFRRFGPVPSVRTTQLRGTIAEYPAIVLVYQTTFDGLSTWGGRDGHQTVFGASEDPAVRDRWDELIRERQAMVSKDRTLKDPEINAWLKTVMPSMPLEDVRRDIDDKLARLVESMKPYGAKTLDKSFLGQYGAQLAPHLSIHVRDCTFGLTGDDDSHAGATPYFWVILSGGPKTLPTGFLPAFPGAEGFGAMTTGGRGGKVIHVTTLEPTGPGSLTEALNTPGPRTVLFDVSGQIALTEDTWITEPDLTLIGYTAPGEGVEIFGRLCIAAGNVVMRGMRWRLRPPIEGDGMNTRGSMENVIFDHCSFAYGSDEIIRFVGGATFVNGTMQYSILGPGTAGLGTHPHGPEVGGVFSFHHNVLYNTMSRSPEVDCTLLDWRNNILYNTRSGHSRRLDNKMNYVDNLIVANPSGDIRYSFRCADNNFMDGNLFALGDVATEFLPHKSTYLQESYPVLPVTSHKTTELEAVILPIVGASQPVRDATDAHWIAGLRDRTGKPVYWKDNKDGWESYDLDSNVLTNFEVLNLADFPGPPAPDAAPPADADRDGMTDAWELANGLDPTDPADAAADPDNDGYTNLEESLYRTDPNVFVDYKNPANNRDNVFTSG
jgi:hypothetical protein